MSPLRGRELEKAQGRWDKARHEVSTALLIVIIIHVV